MREACKFNVQIHNGNILMSSVTEDPGVSSILLFSGSGINFPRPLYECIALSGVARFNTGPNRATVKEISILFDYEQEHTILYKGWLGVIDVELLPTEPRTVTTALGRPVETRPIAIIPLQPTKKEGEPVVIGAWVVESATWSKGAAPTIKNLRERFVARPTISKAHTARNPRMIDLVVGRDSPKIFPELAQEARHIKTILSSATFCPARGR
jgi:hypothetical protein